jgi:hypothetical protein
LTTKQHITSRPGNVTPSASTAPNTATRWMKQIAIYLVAAAAALTAIARLGKHVEILFPHCPKLLWIPLAFLPLLVAVLLSLFRTSVIRLTWVGLLQRGWK